MGFLGKLKNYGPVISFVVPEGDWLRYIKSVERFPLRNRSIWVILLLLFASTFVSAQKPEFFKEDISFGIDSLFFSVNGDYYFRNTSDDIHKFVVVYPVRSNDTSKPIDTIMVFDLGNPGGILKVDVKDTLATFAISLPPHSEKTVRVFYRQRHNGKEVRYILLTTKFWNKPFERADYSLAVGRNIKINNFSLKPDKSVDFGETVIFYWERENFMPENDFEVKFTLLPK